MQIGKISFQRPVFDGSSLAATAFILKTFIAQRLTFSKK